MIHLLIILILASQALSTTLYHKELNYSIYSENFKENAGETNTKEVTIYGTGKETCDGKPCRFFIYIYEPDNLVDDNSSILFVSGLHGNQKIGPSVLMYAYPLLKNLTNRRLIYFPIGNPSGYNKNSRQTYPNRIDLNRDYPIDGNKNCYQGSATRIIDYIFRTYKIDLTLNLHNGASEIGWNWGTNARKTNSHAEDYLISYEIGKMLQFFGGSNRSLRVKKFKIGTMTQSIYPASGTLDDWAYSASWNGATQCKNYKYDPYPEKMNNCLMFLFQLGDFSAPESTYGTSDGLNIDPKSTETSNGYISRALRMLRQMVMVLNPQIQLINFEDSTYIKLTGCNSVKFDYFFLKIDNQIKQEGLQMQKIEKESFTHYKELKFKKNPQKVQLTYKFRCDENWRDLGTTIFAGDRVYEARNKEFILEDKSLEIFIQKRQKRNFIWVIIIFSVIIGLGIVYRCRRKAPVQEEKFEDLKEVNTQNQLSK